MIIRKFQGKGRWNNQDVEIFGEVHSPEKQDENFYSCLVKLDPILNKEKKLYGVTPENALEGVSIFLNNVLTDSDYIGENFSLLR